MIPSKKTGPSKKSGLLHNLSFDNPYPDNKQLLAAYRSELDKTYYKDENIVITEHFLGYGRFALLLDGILDAKVSRHRRKREIILSKLSLDVLYFDGCVVNFHYYRQAGFDNIDSMEIRAKELSKAINIIASKGRNFRKYDICRL